MRSENRKLLNIIFHLVLAVELAVFQVFWPLAIARAETTTLDQPTVESQSENNNNTADGTSGSADDTDENTKSDEPTWKSCDLSEKETDLIKKDKCGECRRKTDCGKIKVCLAAFIDITNETEVKNESESNANTGENEIKVEKDSPAQAESDTSSENTEAGTESRSQEICPGEENTAGQLSENNECGSQSNIDLAEENRTSDLEEDEGGQKNSYSSNSNGDVSEEKGIFANENSSIQKETNSAEIETGGAAAQVNVYNEVNTNIIGENTGKVMENIEGVYNNDVNLLETFEDLLNNVSKSGGKGDLVDININNIATVENNAQANANTGKNSITGVGDEALISTGDAIAVANIANIVNLNLIGNNWLFATINIFGEWIGNLIVPGEGLLNISGWGSTENVSITTENSAAVENSAEANASTGGNSIEGENTNASIETGSAQSGSNVLNVVNTTIIKNNWFFLVINNMGSWIGKVIHWGGDDSAESYSYNFNSNENWENSLISWFANIFIKNTADVENSVSANADTGGNSIDGNFENAFIRTGDAYARTNVWNFVNTNIIGSNWLFATVNIFGSWKGNIDFAYPDIEVSISDGRDRAQNGEEIAYSVSYRNNGKADCEGVDLQVRLPRYVDFQSDSSGISPQGSGNSFIWHLPGLKAGEIKSFSIRGSVSNSLPEGEFAFTTLAAVKTNTKEVEVENNVSSDETIFYRLAPAVGNIPLGSENSVSSSGDRRINSTLSISRKISDKRARPGDIVKHTIIIENTGEETLTSIVVQDMLKNKKGRVGTYQWEVGSLGKGQKAIMTYSLRINAGAPSGDYRSKAVAFGYNPNEQEVKSPAAEVTFYVAIPENSEEYYYDEYYQNYPPVQYLEDNSGWASPAEAAEGDLPGEKGRIMGKWTNGVCNKLPWWGWLAAAIVYLTAVHWSLLRQKQIIKSVKNNTNS